MGTSTDIFSVLVLKTMSGCLLVTPPIKLRFSLPTGKELMMYSSILSEISILNVETSCHGIIHNLFPDEFPDTTFAEFYNPSTYLASANKICEDQDRIPNFRMKWDAAYHFDASLFGEWLKNNLCQNVKHAMTISMVVILITKVRLIILYLLSLGISTVLITILTVLDSSLFY